MSSKTTTNTASPAAQRTDNHRGSAHIAAAAVMFVLSAVAAVMLLLAAASMLLAEWLDSELLAAAVLGGVMALAALAIYLIWIRPAAVRMAARIESLFAVAATAGEAIDWIREKYRFLKLLLVFIRRNW